ncbi:Ig-like domain-containing protein, partial [Flavobacteriaceae bacterium]|nr:Ig-like domain-containing protein [Flavobacteriaceae bacterium]
MNLIKKHIIKNILTLKKVLFIGLLSFIFNSNLHAQLAGPSSSWNTVIQSDVYGDAFKEDGGGHPADIEDVFGNIDNPVLEFAYNNNGDNDYIYFKVLLHASTNITGKKFKFYIGIDVDGDNRPDFFIYHERKENKENDNYSNDNKIKFYGKKLGYDQSGPYTTAWDKDYKSEITGNDRYLSNSTAGALLGSSSSADHHYIFGFSFATLKDWVRGIDYDDDDNPDFSEFDSDSQIQLIAFTAYDKDKLKKKKSKDILGVNDSSISSGDYHNSNYSWSDLFVTNSFDGFAGNGDNTAPTVSSFTLSNSALKSGETATVTIEFSEAVTGFASNDDITVPNGSLPPMTSSDNITWTGTYTPTAGIEDDSNVLTLATSYTDTVGNAGPSATTANFTIDTAAPSVSSFTLSNSALKSGETATVTIEFSEAVTGFASNDDITVPNGSLPPMTSSDNITWTGTYTPTAGIEDDSNVLTLATSYTDTVGNAGPSATTTNFTIDTAAPTITAIQTTAFSWGSVLNATEDNSDGTVSVTTSGVEEGQTLTITLNGATYTNTVSSNSVTVTISAAGLQALTNGSSYTLTADVSDTAGNAATQVTSSSFSVETTAPTISEVLLAADNSTLTVTMSEAVYNTNGGSDSIEMSDFALSISGGVASINATPSTISSSGNEYTLGLTISGTPNGSETLTVVPSSSSAIYDLAGNAASTTQSNNTVSLNDTSPPTLSNVSIVSNNTTNTLAKAGDEITLTFTASETINEPVVTFQSGSSSTTDSSVTYTNTSGNTWTAKYTANASDTDGSVSFSIAFTDGSNPGTDVTTGSGSVTYDNTLPTISSFTTSTSSGSYNQAEEIVITANTTESVQSGNTITVTLDTSDTVLLTAASTGTTLVGTYTVGSGDTSTGLTVSSFTIGTVADTAGNAMTSTTLPSAGSIFGSKTIIIDTAAPTLSEQTVVSTPSNDTTPSYIFTTDEAGTITTSISQNFSTSFSASTGSDQTITFNTLPEGTYSGQTITVTDIAGNAGSITIPDFVIDVTVPVITLTGADVSQEVGGSYSDAGATASDNIDGTITNNIVVAGQTVDPSTVGVYTVTYNVSDAA